MQAGRRDVDRGDGNYITSPSVPRQAPTMASGVSVGGPKPAQSTILEFPSPSQKLRTTLKRPGELPERPFPRNLPFTSSETCTSGFCTPASPPCKCSGIAFDTALARRPATKEGSGRLASLPLHPSSVDRNSLSSASNFQLQPALFLQHLCLRIFIVQLSIHVRFVLLGVKLASHNLPAPCFQVLQHLRPFLDLLVLTEQILLCLLHLVNFFTAPKRMLLVPSSAILRATATRSRLPAP